MYKFSCISIREFCSMVVLWLYRINFHSVHIFADFKIHEICENMYSAKITTLTGSVRDYHYTFSYSRIEKPPNEGMLPIYQLPIFKQVFYRSDLVLYLCPNNSFCHISVCSFNAILNARMFFRRVNFSARMKIYLKLQLFCTFKTGSCWLY